MTRPRLVDGYSIRPFALFGEPGESFEVSRKGSRSHWGVLSRYWRAPSGRAWIVSGAGPRERLDAFPDRESAEAEALARARRLDGVRGY